MPGSRRLLLHVVGPYSRVPEGGSSFLSPLFFGSVLEKDTMRRQCPVRPTMQG